MTDTTGILTNDALMNMSQPELDDLYRSIESPGAIPVGTARGTVGLFPGTWIGKPLRAVARLLLWQGKIFNATSSDLKNRISPARIPAIRAKVYTGESWMDDKPAIILDYSKTSFVAKMIRDEIREVATGLWLGKVFVRRWHALDFTLSS
jgi:hypothetical protein